MYHFFYASNFLYPSIIYYDTLAHFWSLAVEEQFYIAWPFLILLMPINVNKMKLFIWLIVFSIGFKALMIFLFSADSSKIAFMMPACIDSFALGAIALLMKNKQINKQKLIAGSVLSLVIFAVLQAMIFSHPSQTLFIVGKLFSRSVFSFFCCTLLLMIVKDMHTGVLKTLLTNYYLMLLGKMSYGVYIFHLFVPGMLAYFGLKFGFSLSRYENYFFQFTISFLIAWISYKFIETPVNGLKRKYT